MKNIILIFHLLISVSSFAQQKDIEYWRNAAKESVNLGHVEAGIRNYKEILKIDTVNYDATLAIAQLYYRIIKYDESFKYFKLLYDKNNEDTKVLNGIGRIFFRKGEYKKAAIYFNNAIKTSPEDVPPYFDLALAYNGVGDFDASLRTYQKINNLDNTYAEAWGGIGNILLWQEKPYDAIPYFEKAFKLDPSNLLWKKKLETIKSITAFNFSATLLSINEQEEIYEIDAIIQKYGLSKRLSNRTELSLNTLFDKSNRDYPVDSLDANRWYDNSWLKFTYILPKNRFSVYSGYSKSDDQLTTYGINCLSTFKISNIKLRNSLTAGYDYFYYWNQVGKNSISNKLTATFKKYKLDVNLLAGEVTENIITDYFQNVYDTITNLHYAYSVTFRYQLLKNPKTSIGVSHSYYDFKYQSPKYYTPNERYLNGVVLSTYYEWKKFSIYGDYSYNLGQETFYEEKPNGIHDNGIFKYDEILNTNLNNWAANLDIGYKVKKMNFSVGAGRFFNPYYENTTFYFSFRTRLYKDY